MWISTRDRLCRILVPMNSPEVFSYRQLHAAGYTRAQIERSLREGIIQRSARGWYASPLADPTVVRALEVKGHLGCLSGCRFYGVWTPPTNKLHVVYEAGDRPLPASGVLFHAANQPSPQQAVWPLRDCLDHVLHRHSTEDALIVIESAINLLLVSSAEVHSLCSARPVPGEKVRHYLSVAESGSETRVRLFFRRRNVKVTPQVWIEGVGRVDLMVGDRLIIECDSAAHHGSPAQQERDRHRDLMARALGFDTIRLTYHQIWDDWENTQALLSRELKRRRHIAR